MSKQLLMSVAYRAYTALGSVPEGAEPFETNQQNQIEVHFGEIYCRVKLGNELCGNTLKTRGALVTHIKKHHEGTDVKAAEGTGNPSMAKIIVARAWYSSVMDVHELSLAKASERVTNSTSTITEALPTPSRRSTRASAEADATPIPIGSERFELPLYKKSNKKKKQEAGTINFTAAANMIKKARGAFPCDTCKTLAEMKGNAKLRECKWKDSCRSTEWFKDWDSDSDKDRDDDTDE